MKRGGLDVYNDQSSEEFLCDASSGTSGLDGGHSPNGSPLSDVLLSVPLPDLGLSAAVVDALHTQQFVNLACDLADSTEVSSPLLDSLRQMAELACWRASQASVAALDAAQLQQGMRVIFDDIQNSNLPMPFDLHGLVYPDDISSSLFEVNRTACFLLLDGISAGLRSSSPAIAECVKEVQSQVNAISFLRNVRPEQYLFAACIAKSFAADIDMTFMNELITAVNDHTIKTTVHLLLATAHLRDSVW